MSERDDQYRAAVGHGASDDSTRPTNSGSLWQQSSDDQLTNGPGNPADEAWPAASTAPQGYQTPQSHQLPQSPWEGAASGVTGDFRNGSPSSGYDYVGASTQNSYAQDTSFRHDAGASDAGFGGDTGYTGYASGGAGGAGGYPPPPDGGNWGFYPPSNNHKSPNNRLAAALTTVVVVLAMAVALLAPNWLRSGIGQLPVSSPSISQPAQTGPSSSSQRAVTQSQTTASEAQSKGVVLITTQTTSGAAAGTGMVLSSDGYVLTNYHVVESSTQITVTIAATNKEYTATVVGHDATNDVALLKLSGASNLDTVTIDNDTVKAGDSVTAVGNSQGQGYLSAATGQLTSTSSSITVQNETSASQTETLTNVYETSTQAVPGDSGGPMFDSENEVLGITTAGETQADSRTGTSSTVSSYAIPIARAMDIVKQIESGQSSGTVQVGPKAYMGVTVQGTQGGSVVISQVVSGGPAADSGLSVGQLITAVDGTAINSQATLSTVLAGHKPGDTISVTVSSAYGSGSQTVSMTLGSSPIN